MEPQSAPLGAVTHLTLVTLAQSPDIIPGDVILTEAYRRLGIALTIKKYPGERALRLSNSGAADGEVMRIDTVKTLYPNLIQVRPAVSYLEASTFVTKTEFVPSGWESLRPFRIGIIRGVKFAETNTEGMDRHPVGSYGSVFEMLDAGRIEVAATSRLNGLFFIRSIQSNSIKEAGDPIMRFDLFHYIHKKHASLVPRIAAVLRAMEQSGELEEIRAHVTEVMMERAELGLPLYEDGQIDITIYNMNSNPTDQE